MCYLDKKQDRYSISYETRNKSKIFLENIDENSKEHNENVDFFHMHRVYERIKSWFEEDKERGKPDYKNKFKQLLLEKAQFIWYETSEDPIKVFTRLNIGKIGLTNSELIKALILSQSNFDEKFVVRQNEIANEWNDIEQSLQNDEFWYFINEKDYNKPTRIDFLFDVLCELDIENMGKDEKKSYENKIGTDKYRTFRHYDILLKEKKKKTGTKIEYEVQWDRVKSLFEVLNEWYKDVDFYHYIGYILCCKKSEIKTLYKEWTKTRDKEEFIEIIKEKVKSCIEYDLEQQYEIPDENNSKKVSINKTECRPILLLHNIQTVINQNKQAESVDKFKIPVFYRFPFYLYKTEGWDVEHIDSNTTNDLKDNFSKLLWLLQYYESNKEGLNYTQMIKEIIEHIKNKVNRDKEIKEEDIKKTVRLMKILRGLRLASVLSSVSNLCLTEEEFKQHKLLKKRNTFNICCINEAREVLNNAKVVGEDGNIECPTLLFSSNGKNQEIDWVLNQQKFAEIMGAKLISYDCEHYIHHFKSDEMSEEIFRFVNSFIL